MISSYEVGTAAVLDVDDAAVELGATDVDDGVELVVGAT